MRAIYIYERYIAAITGMGIEGWICRPACNLLQLHLRVTYIGTIFSDPKKKTLFQVTITSIKTGNLYRYFWQQVWPLFLVNLRRYAWKIRFPQIVYGGVDFFIQSSRRCLKYPVFTPGLTSFTLRCLIAYIARSIKRGRHAKKEDISRCQTSALLVFECDVIFQFPI